MSDGKIVHNVPFSETGTENIVVVSIQRDGIHREARSGPRRAAAVMSQTQPASLRQGRGPASRQDRLRHPQLRLSREYLVHKEPPSVWVGVVDGGVWVVGGYCVCACVSWFNTVMCGSGRNGSSQNGCLKLDSSLACWSLNLRILFGQIANRKRKEKNKQKGFKDFSVGLFPCKNNVGCRMVCTRGEKQNCVSCRIIPRSL